MRCHAERVWTIAALVATVWCVEPQPLRAAPSPVQRTAPAASREGSAIARCDRHCRAELHASIRCNESSWRRWQRGSLLVAFGVPAVVGGISMVVVGALAWNDGREQMRENADDGGSSQRAGIALTMVGAATIGGGATMIEFGRRDRDAAMRSARMLAPDASAWPAPQSLRAASPCATVRSSLPPTDPVEICDRRCRADLRARIRCNQTLWRRWVRGSLLMGFGVPLVVAAIAMVPAGATLWADGRGGIEEYGDDARRRMRMGIALTWIGAALLGGGATMIAFGRRDRDAVMMSARLRWDLSVAPGRDGARLGLRLRF